MTEKSSDDLELETERLAARQGDAAAQFRLAERLSRDDRADKAEASGWYRRAAEAGHAAAQLRLGERLDQGRGSHQNWDTATKWYWPSADQGDPKAQFLLGGKHYLGYEVPPDKAAGLEFLRQAAEGGHVGTMPTLADMCLRGKWIGQDKAARWFSLAANEGSDEARYQLGLMSDKGDGGAKGQGRGPQMAQADRRAGPRRGQIPPRPDVPPW
ncbi:MAG: sel1 repeat family protein [Deltaproteobacteria bacterium]|jgi:TPR repeat protein|nr:sel1 repeat family protein [Deltaproteobacteria bacterium]